MAPRITKIRRREAEPIERVHVQLFQGDKEIIAGFYPKLGYNAVIRQLTRSFVKRLQAQAQVEAPASDDIQLPPGLRDDLNAADDP